MKKKAIQRLLKVDVYQPGRPIDEVKRQMGLRHVIKLASNENPFEPSPKVLQAIARSAKTINRYPDGGCFYLRASLSKYLKVNGNQLIFGNGSDEVIIMVLRAFVEPKDQVVVSNPSFAVYAIGSQIAGADLKVIPMKDMRHDLNAMRKAVTKKTKVIFIDNPGNPSGTYVNGKELKSFLDSLPKDVVVFLDEAYYEYGCSKSDYPKSLGWLKKYKNLIISRTFSKMYGLAGLRLGYAVSSPQIIDILNRVREPFNVNSIAQDAAIACLKDQAYYNKALSLLEKERKRIYNGITQLGLTYISSVTNFILIDVAPKSGRSVAQALMKQGVITRDMTAWGLKNFIRVTIGKPTENTRFLGVLADVLKGKSS